MSLGKKLFDLGFAILILVLLLPVILLIALCIYLDSPGKVIFSQSRLGKDGIVFFMHKFRKFPVDWGSKGPGVTTRGDVRMTRVGRFIERTKLDELPQLWNILKGEMSFVGPRPESVRHADLFTGRYKKVLDYIPGIFGPNQVAYRNESAMYPGDMDPDEFYRTQLFAKKAQADIDYFRQSNCWHDIAWIIKGIYGTVIGVLDWNRLFGLHLKILIIDLILIQLAWFFTQWFRFGWALSDKNFAVYLTGCWLLPLILLPLMIIGGCYRHPIRYFSLTDLIRLIFVVSFSWLFAILISIGFFHRDMSIALALLGLFLLLGFLTLPRVWRRERWLLQHNGNSNGYSIQTILIYGAGYRGNALARFLEKGFSEIKIVGLIDEDENLRGKFINGYKVFGSWRDVNLIFDKFTFKQLWVADNITQAKQRLIQQWGEKNNIKVIFLSNIGVFSEFYR